MNYIVFSKDEAFRDGAEKIKSEALLHNKTCELIEIGDVAENTLPQDIGSLVYFLTNNALVGEKVNFFKKRGVRVVNEKALLGDVSKFFLQDTLRENRIHVPKSILTSGDGARPEELQYPMFIKSQYQASTVIKVENESELEKHMKNINNTGTYYFEQAVTEENFLLQKYYYIHGTGLSIDYKDAAPQWLCLILENMSRALNLEVFSADIFINWATKDYYCIDINPASSFFMSDGARSEFIKSILV